jgi:hypothetical protein
MSVAGCADIETLSIGEAKKLAHSTATEQPEFMLLQGMVSSPPEGPIDDIAIGESAFSHGIQADTPIDAFVNARTANTTRNLRRTKPVIPRTYHSLSDLQSNLLKPESLSYADDGRPLILSLGSCQWR